MCHWGRFSLACDAYINIISDSEENILRAYPVKVIVSFDKNGGGNSDPELKVSYDEGITLADAPTRDGFKCLGWAKDKNATKADYAIGAKVNASDIATLFDNKGAINNKTNTYEIPATLYAVWEKAPTNSNTNPTTTPTEEYYDATFTENGYNFKVISQEAKTVELVSPVNKKQKNYVVPAKVTHKDMTYTIISIGDKAFIGCKKAKSFKLSASVNRIGNQAFFGLAKLGKFTVPVGVTEIGAKAFFNCKNLGTFTVKTKVLKKVGAKALGKTKWGIKLKFPKSKKKKYRKYFRKSGAKGIIYT